MKIKSIKYPEGCQLKGWKKMVFERRIKAILGSFFSVCELDQCRAEILGQERDKERYDELHVFHCESFENMSVGEAQALADKTAQYVGVEITTKFPSRIPGVVAALMGGVLIGAGGAWLIPAVQEAKGTVSRPYVERSAGVAGLSPVLPVANMGEQSPEPILTTTVRTDRPAVTARTLARTVPNDVGEFEVSLTVTPVKRVGDQ